MSPASTSRPHTLALHDSGVLPSVADLRVAVLRGGRSSEREVSLRSGETMIAALRSPASSDDRRGPAQVLDVECCFDGRWRLGGESASPGECIASLDPAVVFALALHGGEGENGTIQGLLDSHGRIYTGSGVAASALCMNKHVTRLVLRHAGLSVAPARIIDRREWESNRTSVIDQVARLSSQGWSVKPNCGGSSVSTFLVAEVEEAGGAIDAVLATGDRALVEQRVVGVEATCAVLGNCDGPLRAFTPVEIVPHPGRFFDYHEKYSASGAEEHCPPRGISAGSCERIRELSCRAHRAAGCDGYSRIDYIVPRTTNGGEGEPVVLEINTLPGMTSRSLMPKAAVTDGLSLRDLLLEILGLALARRGGSR
jgi:D-alanine-D-alanine ligase